MPWHVVHLHGQEILNKFIIKIRYHRHGIRQPACPYIILSIYPNFKTLIFENNTKIVLTRIKIIRIFVTSSNQLSFTNH